MLETSYLFWLLFILIVIQNFDLSRGIFVEKWIKQYQDHFDYFNDKTWSMRYYENDEFYHQSGPIFIRIEGESAISPFYTSIMYEMAKANGAMMYITEHRYYGKSHPVPDTSTKNLRYLRVSQALADIALFIDEKKQELNNSNAFVMVYGGSYAGNLAAWMRVDYPELVQAALADSAPIYVKANFFEYYAAVENSIRKKDKNCAISIKEAFSTLEIFSKNPAIISAILEDDFKVCDADVSHPSEIPYMMNTLAQIFSQAVSYNTIEMNRKTQIENLCISMTRNQNISSYDRLAEVFKKKFLQNYPCINWKYRRFIDSYSQTSWESQRVRDRLWSYQICTELGYHMTSSSLESIFGSLISRKYFADQCKHLFKDDFSLDNQNVNIKRINYFYNSKLSNTKNIIFTNGDLDPWHPLSVLSDLNADSPAILIEDASHCDFLKQNKAIKTENLNAANCQVSSMINEWIYEYKKLQESLTI